MVVPYQGPSSDYVVVKMIPDSRLPPRHLHVVHTGKTSAVIKWESPYDSPDQDLVSRPGVQAAYSRYGWVWGVEEGRSCNGTRNLGLVLGAQGDVSPLISVWPMMGSFRCCHLAVTSPSFLATMLICPFFFSAFSTFTNKALQAKSSPLPVFLNKVLLAPSYTCSFARDLWLLSCCRQQS